VTALLTPLTIRQVDDPSVGIVVKVIFMGGFPAEFHRVGVSIGGA
jgi:hypothetical protein